MAHYSQRQYYQQNQSVQAFLNPQQSVNGQVAAARRKPPSTDNNSLDGSPYTIRGGISGTSISDKFSLSPDPRAWGSDLSGRNPEPDDYLHNPDPTRDRKNDQSGSVFTGRGCSNVGCLLLLLVVLMGLFAGYPVASFMTTHRMSLNGGFNLGGINATGQVPVMPGKLGPIDADTPSDAYTYKSTHDGTELQLVFSDEFNKEGRTFYPGDDPYWEAVDLHYWGTNNMEWYDPEGAITQNGSLKITLSRKRNHDLDYQGGMIQSWNKFCFTGGLVVASVVLPGSPTIPGLWPAIWAMGNLGRAGYGASLEGMWPYTYDACDVGTLANQTLNGEPHLATVDGDSKFGGVLSYLPGQKLSRCTCKGESHPGPVHSDGSYVGRAAPEIDIFEAQVGYNFAKVDGLRHGEVSQSGQWAPFNYAYNWFDTPQNQIIVNETITVPNGYKGGTFQQATSCVTKTNPKCYSQAEGCYSIYGFEYKPGYNDAYITWLSDGIVVWTVNAGGLAADDRVKIAARPIPQEPMYLIANLGMSMNFGDVDLENLVFPASMLIDYIRVYQDPKNLNVGCDPKNFPTAEYIKTYKEAYSNPNLTTWKGDYKKPFPKNKLIDKCE